MREPGIVARHCYALPIACPVLPFSVLQYVLYRTDHKNVRTFS